MCRALPKRSFAKWFWAFVPGLASGELPGLLKPAIVTDRSDPKLVHLDGLNLSRAWCMKRVATTLPSYSTARRLLRDSAQAHLNATLPHIASGNYEGEHWLATFAVLALSEGSGQ